MGYWKEIQSILSTLPVIEAWQPTSVRIVTQLRRSGNQYWLSCPDIGAISIDCASNQISTYPIENIDQTEFGSFLTFVWFPFAYQLCGIQVIHASAVVNHTNNTILAFCGDSGAGKSTLAFGLAKRDNWTQIADDRIAFNAANGEPKLIFIPDRIKLRPPTADYFGEEPFGYDPCTWLETPMTIKTIFFINPKKDQAPHSRDQYEIRPLSKADSYKLLLSHAFSITTQLQENNQKLLNNYLGLLSDVNFFQLSIPTDFNLLEDIYNAIEAIVE
ncbi:MAG: hypothetical protein JW757_09800 [Anaerolineales bacterium]|nr:hypothetical protein [Anaerolineales bacterium]